MLILVIVNGNIENGQFESVTQRQFLPGVWRKCEAEQCHAGDEDTGNYQVEEVVESPPSDVYSEGDVHVGLRAAVVGHTVLLPGHSFNYIVIIPRNSRLQDQCKRKQTLTGQNRSGIRLELTYFPTLSIQIRNK